MGQQQNQYSNTYNSGQRNPPNRPWCGPGQSNQPRPPYQYQAQSSNQGSKMSTLESALEKLSL
ncbi:hypothetical protein SESBI_49185 [Sesbania bispinosa]|nr:hypothetical protein SESBI_49185 [Sesbania bispinosa]